MVPKINRNVFLKKKNLKNSIFISASELEFKKIRPVRIFRRIIYEIYVDWLSNLNSVIGIWRYQRSRILAHKIGICTPEGLIENSLRSPRFLIAGPVGADQRYRGGGSVYWLQSAALTQFPNRFSCLLSSFSPRVIYLLTALLATGNSHGLLWCIEIDLTLQQISQSHTNYVAAKKPHRFRRKYNNPILFSIERYFVTPIYTLLEYNIYLTFAATKKVAQFFYSKRKKLTIFFLFRKSFEAYIVLKFL